MHPLRQGLYWLLSFAVLAAAALSFSLFTGSADISVQQVFQLLWVDDGSTHHQIIHQLRLPRTLSAFAVGGALALAGALIQVLLRNPLGDPYVLGISGGAATAVLIAMLLGLPFAWHTPAAFGGALASMMLVFLLGHRDNWNTSRLLLTGIVIAAGWSALISFVLSLSPPVKLPGMLFWLMGDLGDALSPGIPMLGLLAGLLIAMLIAADLNLAAQGDLKASALGVSVGRLRILIYFLASLLTATAVTVAGAVGFIGLISPHMVRLLAGNDHRVVLPGSVLLGGTLLVLADTAARTLVAPMQLPVGVLTAIIGVPVFLFLLNSQYRYRS